MKLKKFVKTVIISMASMSVFVVPVLASNYTYSFELYTDYPDNMYDYTPGNPKNDSEQAAYIYTNSGNIAPSDRFYMTVFGMNHTTQYSQELQVTSNNARYVLAYNQGNYAYTGQQLCIKGETYRYAVSVYGHWYS